MKSYVVFNQQGYSFAYPTEAAAKDSMRQTEGAYTLLHVEIGSGRETLCAFFNRQFTPEMITKQETYDFNGKQLRLRQPAEQAAQG